jgi:glucose-1-phosphate thymidylyltransferase
MTLKGLVLAGGSGTRMRPLTHTRAKQLLPVANRPVLFYALDALRDAGIEEVAIVVGHTADEIMAAVGDGARFGLRTTYLHQDAPRGLAHAVMLAEGFVGGDAFVMYLGDVVMLDGVRPLVEHFTATPGDARLLVAPVRDPRRFGVAVLEGDRVRAVVEKPTVPPSDLGILGAYVFAPAIFASCRAIAPSARGELEITDAIAHLIARGGDVRAEVAAGGWQDTGRPEDLLEANRMVLARLDGRVEGEIDAASTLEGRVVIERGARVRRAVVRGPAIVGAGAVVEDACVGPFASLGAGCLVRGSEVAHAVLLPGARVERAGRIERALLGAGALVERWAGEGLRLVLGDDCVVRG